MEPHPPTDRVLEYEGRSRNIPRRSPVRPMMLALLALGIAAVNARATFNALWHRQETIEYMQHLNREGWERRWDPQYAGRAFVGRRYIYESVWEVKALYPAVVATIICGLAIRSAVRRQWPGDEDGVRGK